MENFAPVSATVGGALIGLAASIIWVVNGRRAGVSGIVGGLFPVRQGDALWRLVFAVGLPIGAIAGLWLAPMIFPQVPASLPTVDATPALLVTAGLAVGVGTRIGRGCTSGHGICGMSRLSKRSFAAVAMFLGTAALAVFVTRHVL